MSLDTLIDIQFPKKESVDFRLNFDPTLCSLRLSPVDLDAQAWMEGNLDFLQVAMGVLYKQHKHLPISIRRGHPPCPTLASIRSRLLDLLHAAYPDTYFYVCLATGMH